MKKISYTRRRFPAAVIHRAVWLYFRIPLRFRDVEEMMAERGVVRSGLMRRNIEAAVRSSRSKQILVSLFDAKPSLILSNSFPVTLLRESRLNPL
jgi:hypothetical protein